MTDIASLVARIDATSSRQARRDLDDFTASGGRAEGQSRRLADAGAALGRVLGGIGFALIAQQALQLADAYKSVEARLSLVTKSTYELQQASGALFEIAQRTRVGFENTADLYGNLSRATRSLGTSQNELLGVTETINQALIVSGASAGAAQAALTQLSQGFASGTLRGDELNSVLEQTPRLAQAIAEGMGVTIGQLRALGAEGKITGQAVFEALKSQRAAVEAEFSAMPLTISQAMTQAQNAILRYVGEADKAAGISRTLAEAISFAAENAEEIGDVLVKVAQAVGALAAIITTRYIVSLTLAAAAQVRATVTAIAMAAAISGTSVAASAGALAVRGLGAAFTFMGGPLGLVVVGLGALALEVMKTDGLLRQADEAIRGAAGRLKELEASAAAAAPQAAAVGSASLGAALGVEVFGGKAGVAAQKLYDLAAAAKYATYQSLVAERTMLASSQRQLEQRTVENRRGALEGRWTPANIWGHVSRRVTGDVEALWTGGESDQEIEGKLASVVSKIGEVDAALRRVAGTSETAFIPAIQAAAAATDEKAKASGRASQADKDAERAAREAAEAAERQQAALQANRDAYRALDERLAGPTAAAYRKLREEQTVVTQLLAAGELSADEAARKWDALTAEYELNAAGIREVEQNVSDFIELPVGEALRGWELAFENWLQRAEYAAEVFDRVSFSVEDVFGALSQRDWGSAVTGLIRAVRTVQTAWKEAANAAERHNVIAGIANAAGQMIGGRAGSAISGAASGFMLGNTIMPGIGGVVGGILGGLGGLFGGGGEKRRQREEEERRKAEEAARRAAEIAAQAREFELRIIELTQGATAALAERRKDELAATDASNRASLERIWQLEDEAEAAAKAAALAVQRQDIELEILRLTGQEAAAVAIERQRELEALDPSLRALQERVFALQDEAAAAELAATVGRTFAADLAAIFGNQPTHAQIVNAARADRERAEQAAAEKAKEAAEAAATAWGEFLATVDAAAPALIRAGDAIGALAGEMSKVKLDTGAFTNRDGSFNYVNYNLAIAKEQAEAAKRLSDMASSMSLSVENVGGFLADLRGVVGDSKYGILGGQAIQNELRNIAGFVGEGYSNAIRDAVSGFAEVIGLEGVRQRFQAGGMGLAGVRAAQENLAFASSSPWGGMFGMGADVAAYGQAVDRLKGLMQAGKITAGDYVRALEGLDFAMGSNIAYVGDVAAQMERVAQATWELGQVGLASISQGFGQITDAADALAAAAKEANEPIAQVTGAIGRLISYAQVFGESAQAAIQGGQGGSASVGTAALIAEAASIAAGIITTQQAKALAEATGLDKGLTLLLDGLQAFDPASFETAFLRLNDALVTGSISAAEYQQLFQTSIGIFDGTAEALDGVRKAARSLADELRVSDLTYLNPAGVFAESKRQTDELMKRVFGGDAGAFSDLGSSVRTTLESFGRIATSGQEYDRFASRIIAQVAALETLPAVDYSADTAANTANVVAELKGLRAQVEKLQSTTESQTSAVQTTADWTKRQVARQAQG